MHATNPYRGLTAVRFLKALAAAKGSTFEALAYAQGQNWRETPNVIPALKAATDPVDTTSGAGLVPSLAGFDYSEFIRPQTIIGRLAGLSRVPFHTRVLTQTTPTSAGWVGEGAPKPVTRSDFDGDTLPAREVAALAVITQELALSSAPSAEAAISRDIARAGVQAIDLAFIDPANAGVSGAKPASVTNGAIPIPSTGSALVNIDTDAAASLYALDAAGSDLGAAAWVMRARTAIHLSRVRGTGGAPAYPFITAKGGTFFGLPVVVSNNVPLSALTGDSTSIILLDAAGIVLADDGEAELGATMEASIQMLDDPITGAAQQISCWALNLACLKMSSRANWLLRRAGFVQVISEVQY